MLEGVEADLIVQAVRSNFHVITNHPLDVETDFHATYVDGSIELAAARQKRAATAVATANGAATSAAGAKYGVSSLKEACSPQRASMAIDTYHLLEKNQPATEGQGGAGGVNPRTSESFQDQCLMGHSSRRAFMFRYAILMFAFSCSVHSQRASISA